MVAFLTDEMMPPQLAAALREHGLDAIDIHEAGLRGEPDPKVFAYAHQQDRILVTADLDFSNALQYPPGSHPGIILVRYSTKIPRDDLIEKVTQDVLSIPRPDFVGAIIVLAKKGIRRRGP